MLPRHSSVPLLTPLLTPPSLFFLSLSPSSPFTDTVKLREQAGSEICKYRLCTFRTVWYLGSYRVRHADRWWPFVRCASAAASKCGTCAAMPKAGHCTPTCKTVTFIHITNPPVTAWNSTTWRYLGTALTNQNSIHEDIRSRWKSGNACYHSAEKPFLSSGLDKHLHWFKIHATWHPRRPESSVKTSKLAHYTSMGREDTL